MLLLVYRVCPGVLATVVYIQEMVLTVMDCMYYMSYRGLSCPVLFWLVNRNCPGVVDCIQEISGCCLLYTEYTAAAAGIVYRRYPGCVACIQKISWCCCLYTENVWVFFLLLYIGYVLVLWFVYRICPGVCACIREMY